MDSLVKNAKIPVSCKIRVLPSVIIKSYLKWFIL